MNHWELSAYDNPNLTISVGEKVDNVERSLRELAKNYGYQLPKKISFALVRKNGMMVWECTVPMKDTKYDANY